MENMVLSTISTLQNIFLNADWSALNFVDLLQIAIILFVLAFCYWKFIKDTNSEKIVKGILSFLISIWVLSEILVLFSFKLTILSMFLKGLLVMIILSLVVIFQPELRKFLGYFGQGGFLHKNYFANFTKNKKQYEVDVIKVILETVKHFKKTRTGALIVFQNDNLLGSYSEVGTKLDAILSIELLLTIFHPNTPLHDGAVLINEDKIVAAGVLLPLTEDPKLSWKYGTRHRAAIGMSEQTDCSCLVVSEETGDVSIAVDGVLKKYDDFNNLKSDLENLLGFNDEKTDIKYSFWSLIKKK